MRTIRAVKATEWNLAMAMVWRVFLKFEADVYSSEGIENFRRFITADSLYKMFRQGEYVMFGCFDEADRVLGIISVRNRNHISLLFVDENCQRQGIASALIKYLCDYLLTQKGQTYTTVDSSPYAVEFYHKMGFTDTAKVQKNSGIIYTPMKFFL
ncbi:GNAT family N-acetyltransferase [Lachnospiraceae bacterium C1.1]|nr:GNAT family N-acetyltransferase [Lachnospiraceae bacterium C1.1]